MDIDALTPKKHAEMMHKGLCFRCGKQGHLSHDCPNKNKTVASFAKEAPALKQMKGKELHAHIKLMMASMMEEEKEEFFKEAEESGF